MNHFSVTLLRAKYVLTLKKYVLIFHCFLIACHLSELDRTVKWSCAFRKEYSHWNMCLGDLQASVLKKESLGELDSGGTLGNTCGVCHLIS